MFDTGFAEISYIEETALCLLQAGAEIVRAVWHDCSIAVYKQELSA